MAMTSSPRSATALPLRLGAVHKTLAGVPVVDDLTLEVQPGQIVILLGENGAGKSTTLSMAMGVRAADAGVVEIYGRSVADPTARRRLACVLQDPDFPHELTVGDIIRLIREHFPRAADRGSGHCFEALAVLGIDALMSRRAGGLSGGQTQRLALACALAAGADLLILDEPTTSLDPAAVQTVIGLLRDHVARGGSVLMATHAIEEAVRLADVLVLMHEGRIVDTGTPAEVAGRIVVSHVTFEAEGVDRVVLPGESVQHRDGLFSLYTTDPDGVVRALVRDGVPFTDLMISRPPLGVAVATALGLDGGRL